MIISFIGKIVSKVAKVIYAILKGLVDSFGIGIVLLVIVAAVLVIINKSDAIETPLTKAAEHGDLAEARRLVEGGASVNQKNKLGSTPLERALYYYSAAREGDQYGVAEYLLAQGAEVTNTALQSAINNGFMEMVREMVRRGQKPSRGSLIYYILSNPGDGRWDAQIIDYLLNNGADINFPDSDSSYTALGYAVHYRDYILVEYLVEKGADVNAPMKGGKTPLELAEEGWRQTWEGNPGIHYYTDIPPAPEIANFLKQHGAR